MSEERLRKDINRLKQLTNGCIPEFHQDIEDVLDRFEQLQQENQRLKLDYELYKDNHVYKNYEVETKDNTIKQLKEVIEEVREELKKHKKDLDYEPWSIYKVDGNILFNIKEILDKVKVDN